MNNLKNTLCYLRLYMIFSICLIIYFRKRKENKNETKTESAKTEYKKYYPPIA